MLRSLVVAVALLLCAAGRGPAKPVPVPTPAKKPAATSSASSTAPAPKLKADAKISIAADVPINQNRAALEIRPADDDPATATWTVTSEVMIVQDASKYLEATEVRKWCSIPFTPTPDMCGVKLLRQMRADCAASIGAKVSEKP